MFSQIIQHTHQVQYSCDEEAGAPLAGKGGMLWQRVHLENGHRNVVSFPIEHGDLSMVFCIPEGNLVTNCHENGMAVLPRFWDWFLQKKTGDIYGVTSWR